MASLLAPLQLFAKDGVSQLQKGTRFRKRVQCRIDPKRLQIGIKHGATHKFGQSRRNRQLRKIRIRECEQVVHRSDLHHVS